MTIDGSSSGLFDVDPLTGEVRWLLFDGASVSGSIERGLLIAKEGLVLSVAARELPFCGGVCDEGLAAGGCCSCAAN